MRSATATDWAYPVELRREAGEVHAYAVSLPEAIAAGATDAEALTEMGHALAAAVRGRIKDGMPLDPPVSGGQECHAVPLPARLAVKAAIYAAWKHSGLSSGALAERLGRDEREAAQVLDPDHATRLDRLEEAAVALGGRLRVAFEPA